MRRRMRSATFPLHRHSFAQVALDAVLVAAAYFLSYRLRFDFQHVPRRYELLFERTIAWAVVSSVVIFALFGLYQKWWRYVGQRDYVAIIEAVVVATLSIAAFAVITHPVLVPTSSQRGVSTLYVYAPTSGAAPAGVKPALATTLPRIDGTGRVYTMTLRPGPTFSTGKPVQASDFRASIERAIRRTGAAARVYTNNVAGAVAFARHQARAISGIRVDDATGLIEITLVKPDSRFEHILASPSSAIYPAGTPVETSLSNPPPHVVSQVATGTVDVNVPPGVLALFFLLTLGFVGGARFVARTIYERPLRGFRAAQGRAPRADRRRRRRRPARPARDRPQPRPAAATRSASSTTTRASAACAIDGVTVLGTTPTSSTRILDEVEPDEVIIAIPSAPGTLRGRVVRGVPRARRSRSARCRRSSSCCQRRRQRRAPGARASQVEDILGREPVRDGARPRRRLPRRRGRARHRRRRLDRLRALPPDRARRAAQADPARPRRGQPLPHPARARGRPPRAPVDARRRARRLQGGGADARGASPSTARRSSSTPPPTSTSG